MKRRSVSFVVWLMVLAGMILLAGACSPPKPEPVKQIPVKKEPPKEKPVPPPAAAPEAGSGEIYLQLLATAKPEADVMVDVLRKKGFRARAAQIPERPEIFRVLVGPLADGSVNKTKADLQSSGFPGDKAIKKTF